MISIIVPIYKVENYLVACLDSILNSTYQDFELILVDDGSPDGCGKICDEHAARDNRIKVIHKQNGGLSDARNAGLKVAKGEYIAFVDSDDLVHPKWLETLLGIISLNECDIAVVGFFHSYDDIVQFDDVEILTARQVPVDLAVDQLFNSGRKGFTCNVWTKLYRRAIIGDTLFKQFKAEDLAFNLDLLLKGPRIYCSETPLYYYRLRNDSLTSGRDHEYLLKDIVTRCDIYDYYLTQDKHQKYKPLILESIFQHLLYAKNYPVYSNTEPLPVDEEYYQEVYRRTFDEFMKSDGVSLCMKTKVMFARRVPQVYQLMVKQKKIICNYHYNDRMYLQ